MFLFGLGCGVAVSGVVILLAIAAILAIPPDEFQQRQGVAEPHPLAREI